MRQILALALLVGAMFLLAQLGDWLSGAAVSDDIKTLVSLGITFAGVGFVVLSAYVLAAAGAGFKPLPLPRVTGYIIAGIVLGPHVGAVLSKEVVTDLGNFKELAVALIAFEAGLELQVTAIRKVARSMLSIVAFKIPLSWLMVGGAFLLASPLLPFDLNGDELLTIALVIGALAVGTSPAVSVAVISERSAKGKTPDLILTIAVFKDIVMILMLAVAITIGQGLVMGSEMSGDSFLKLGKKISLSILAGAVLGALLIAFMRWVRWQLVLTLLIVAYGGAVLSDFLHLKSLLVFIAAGFVVSNFSHYGHDLHKPLAMLALPIFIVFFTWAGADLDLEATLAVLPVAAILFVVRVMMMFGATKLGATLSKDPPEFSNNVWLGFISQAGVALGLLIIAQKDLDVLAEPLGQIGVSLIALNLLIGPILLGVSLKRAAPRESQPSAADDAHPPDGSQAPLVPPDSNGGGSSEQDAVAQEAPARPAAIAIRGRSAFGPGPDDPELAAICAELSTHLEEVCANLERDVLGTWLEQVDIRIASLHGQSEIAGTVHAAFEPIDVMPVAQWLRASAREVRDRLAQLPGKVHGPLLGHHRELPLDSSLRQRLVLRFQDTFGRGRRSVALRLVARRYVEGVFVVGLQDALRHFATIEAERIRDLDHAFHTALDAWRQKNEQGSPWQEPEFSTDALRALAAENGKRWVQGLVKAREEALGLLGVALRTAGTAASVGRHRYEDVAMEVDAAIRALDDHGRLWNRALDAAAGRARLKVVLDEIESGVTHDMTQVVRRFTSGQQVDVSTVVDGVRNALNQVRGQLTKELGAMTPVQANGRLNRAAAMLDDVITREALPRIDELRHVDEDGEGVFSTVTRSLDGIIDNLDEQWPALPAAFQWSQVNVPARPEDVPVTSLNLRVLAKRYLIGELKWAYDDAGAQAERMIDRVAVGLGEVAAVVTDGLKTSTAETANASDKKLGAMLIGVTEGSLKRALKIIDALSDELNEVVEAMPTSIGSLTHVAFETLRQKALGLMPEEGALTANSLARTRRNVQTFYRDLVNAYAGVRRSAADFYRRATHSDLAREARVRAGLEEIDEAQMAQDVSRFHVAEAQRDKLPYMLAKLFEGSALDTPQILVGAELERASLLQAWKRFETGEPTSVLLTGDSGSGKTSVAHVAMRELPRRRVCEVKLHAFERSETGFCAAVGAEAGCFEARDFRSLSLALASLNDHIAILLDGFEQVFERTPEGLRHVRKILQLILHTRHRVCWVVTINAPTSRLLEQVCDIKAYFTDWIALSPRTGEQLVDVIEARARLAGFSMEWPTPPVRGLARNFRLAAWKRDVEARRRRFARRLLKTSAGNVRDGLSLFVNAIEAVDDEVVRLNDITIPALSWFGHLGRDAHRVLALAVLTGTISRREAKTALLWTDARVDASLGRLVGSHVLVRSERALGDESGARWEVNGVMWRRVTERLSENNLLIDSARGPSGRERQ